MTALINLLFFLIVAATVITALWLSRKYKERYAEFPWWKAGVIIAIEVVAWVLTASIWNWVKGLMATPKGWVVLAIIGIIVVLLLKRKKREDHIL